jgi:cytochrome c peroxidase
MSGIEMIMEEVFQGRMGGMPQGPRRVRAIARWVDAQPSLPAPEVVDQAAVDRGKALFNDPTVACASCHAGEKLTNNKSEAVGTGEALQVPGLYNLAARAPYMHNGCAATLRDRFDPACGGGDAHGKTSHLAEAQIDDLVAYLESL